MLGLKFMKNYSHQRSNLEIFIILLFLFLLCSIIIATGTSNVVDLIFLRLLDLSYEYFS